MSDRLAISPAPEAREKEDALIAWLRDRGSVLVGFSGGVDSAYLACVAVVALGRDHVVAVTGLSPAYPDEQWETARRVASEFGVRMVELRTDEMDDPRYAANPINRCYFCKRELWSKLIPVARARGIEVVIDGTNADDVHDSRPGARAGVEYGVRSPLCEVGLTKAEIRALSRARGIPTWTQPSSPCLSSRLPHGTPVTVERLRQVERAEAALRALGITGDLRVRHHGDLARVELSPEALAHWTADRRSEAVAAAVRAEGYSRVELDPRGYRSGSLSVLSGAPLSRD
jgi:pyridinium-3,5-biscarboxylic acid mononucleotide sulfurtransferase